MGMFDHVKHSEKCPGCGLLLDRFQSKDGECILDNLEFWEVDNFYTYCKCGVCVNYTIKPSMRSSLPLSAYDRIVRTVSGPSPVSEVAL